MDQVALGVFPPPAARRARANGSESCWHGGAVTRPEYIAQREALLAEKEAEAESKRIAADARDVAANVKTRERFVAGAALLLLLHSGTKVVSDLTSRQIDEVLTALGQPVGSAQANKPAQLINYTTSVGLVFNAAALAIAGDQPQAAAAAALPALPLPAAL